MNLSIKNPKYSVISLLEKHIANSVAGEIKREVNKGHRAGGPARPKKMITSRNPGEERISRRVGEVVLDLCFSVLKKQRK